MTLYIAVDGVDPEALDAADDELIADTVHQLLHEEVLVQDIETVGIVDELKDELDGAVISENNLQILADNANHSLDEPGIAHGYRNRLSKAMDEAYSAMHDNGDIDD
jgi:non-ribosomal peptide synthetase component E (peptide arylation enzyme)